jgi:hypothetical protein
MEAKYLTIYSSDLYRMRYITSAQEMLQIGKDGKTLLDQYVDAISEEPSNNLFGLPRTFIMDLQMSNL